jgi:hypothetical protein
LEGADEALQMKTARLAGSVALFILPSFIPSLPPSLPPVQGIEKGSLAMMNDILLETLGAREMAFLSGPSFAK